MLRDTMQIVKYQIEDLKLYKAHLDNRYPVLSVGFSALALAYVFYTTVTFLVCAREITLVSSIIKQCLAQGWLFAGLKVATFMAMFNVSGLQSKLRDIVNPYKAVHVLLDILLPGIALSYAMYGIVLFEPEMVISSILFGVIAPFYYLRKVSNALNQLVDSIVSADGKHQRSVSSVLSQIKAFMFFGAAITPANHTKILFLFIKHHAYQFSDLIEEYKQHAKKQLKPLQKVQELWDKYKKGEAKGSQVLGLSVSMAMLGVKQYRAAQIGDMLSFYKTVGGRNFIASVQQKLREAVVSQQEVFMASNDYKLLLALDINLAKFSLSDARKMMSTPEFQQECISLGLEYAQELIQQLEEYFARPEDSAMVVHTVSAPPVLAGDIDASPASLASGVERPSLCRSTSQR